MVWWTIEEGQAGFKEKSVWGGGGGEASAQLRKRMTSQPENNLLTNERPRQRVITASQTPQFTAKRRAQGQKKGAVYDAARGGKIGFQQKTQRKVAGSQRQRKKSSGALF